MGVFFLNNDSYVVLPIKEYEEMKSNISIIEKENRDILNSLENEDSFEHKFYYYNTYVYGVNENTKRLNEEIKRLKQEIEVLENRSFFKRLFNKI